jgi:hypothetical protein
MSSFTKEEAESKIGKNIRTNTEFSGLPQRSEGRVVGMVGVVEAGRNAWNVIIQWNVSQKEVGFTKYGYELYLEEL